jgi:hypothetical protein
MHLRREFLVGIVLTKHRVVDYPHGFQCADPHQRRRLWRYDRTPKAKLRHLEFLARPRKVSAKTSRKIISKFTVSFSTINGVRFSTVFGVLGVRLGHRLVAAYERQALLLQNS